jgi:hypothetical protein
METVLGGIAFAALVAAQLFAVIAVHRARLDRSERPMPTATDRRTKIVWEAGV